MRDKRTPNIHYGRVSPLVRCNRYNGEHRAVDTVGEDRSSYSFGLAYRPLLPTVPCTY
jgi:hypothetical protein